MSSNKISNEDFIICVHESDSHDKNHVLIHPILLVSNNDPEEIVSPESVIDGFKFIGGFQNRKLISISKSQVSKKNWRLLIEGVKDSKVCAAGVSVKKEILYA